MAPLAEPLREKVSRDIAATRLDAVVKQLQTAIRDSVHSLVDRLLTDGVTAHADLSKCQQSYVAELVVPTEAGDAPQYTRLVKMYETLVADWQLVQSEGHAHRQTQQQSTQSRTPSGSNIGTQPNTKKPDRPEVKLDMSEAEWSFFQNEWKTYKKQANLLTNDTIVPELRSSCTIELRRALFDFVGSSDLETMQEAALLDVIRQCAVRGKSMAVHRHEFHAMRQAHGQRLHDFVARLRAKAEQCQFMVACSNAQCSQNVSFASEMVSDQMVIGCYDSDIQGEVLAKASTLTTFQQRFDTMQALEIGKEAKEDLTRHATPGSSMPTVAAHFKSDYRKAKDRPPGTEDKSVTDRSHRGPRQPTAESKCFGCGYSLHGTTFREHTLRKRSVCPAKDSACELCKRKGHYTSVCRSRETPTQSSSVHAHTQDSASHYQAFAVESRNQDSCIASLQSSSDSSDLMVPHMEWSDGAFREHKPAAQPLIVVKLKVLDCCHEKYGRKRPRIRQQSRNCASVETTAIADTGAQTCTAGPDLLDALHVPRGYLVPTSHSSVGIDHRQLSYMGCVFLAIHVGNFVTHQAVYVTTGVRGLYLSKTAQIDLGLIDPQFPTSISATESERNENVETIPDAECGCPVRRKPPPKPTHLPFPATPENRKKLEEWIIHRYRASAFNVCEHQPLPIMSGRPLDIHFIDKYETNVYHTPIPVPHHWKGPVKHGLDRDVRIGTLDVVPQGTPVEWCARMIVVPKHDNSPRRAVDLQKLNAATKRETHHTPSPYNQVSVVPPRKKKTVADAWNGYHSLALAPSARDATTFITEWGRYRYLRAPQGFHAAGDGYTRRYDDITVDVERKAKCIDDTLLWDDDIESAFWHTIDYFDLCAANGIVFNPEKFHFAEDEVDFAGFTITLDGIKPVQSMFDAILNFPTPKDVTGMRSWFGLVNQIAYAMAVSPQMAPFRDLLKPRIPWYWDETLDQLFETSKREIAKQIEHGVKAFEVERPTCIATDWSKIGLGFFLLQKHCSCAMTKAPNCCSNGWKLVMAGSRFSNDAESRYAPIEGEALAIVEALDKCRLFVLGCPELLIATDHKPLLKVFGDRALQDIRNQRLLRLKERTLMYKFELTHVPGGWHAGPDALSRYPASAQTAAVDSSSIDEEIQAATVAALYSDSEDDFSAVTWDRIKQAASTDQVIQDLVAVISGGFPENKSNLPANLHSYWNVRDIMSCIDGIPMVGQRVVVPASLRGQVIDNLHSAHQGVSSMRARAALSVYWPTIRNAIEQRRDQCKTCNRIAPSNHIEPLTPTPSPEYPYQQVCADFFHQSGHDYLIYVDRYTCWLNIVQMTGDESAPALIKALRMMFDFGVPEELATDGGPPFTSIELKNFLLRWGVNTRLSSAYYPQSNGRAESAVKTAKRIIVDNTGPRGQLNTDRVVAALLQHRNTPMQDIGLSPAQLLFGRNLRESIPFHQQALKIRPEWKSVADDREHALAKRNLRAMERYDQHTRPLVELAIGDKVLVQNQHGVNPTRWDKTGTVVEHDDHRQYSIKMHGSGRHTLRNRRFLKKIIPMLADTPLPAITTPPPRTHGPAAEKSLPTLRQSRSASPDRTDPADDTIVALQPTFSDDVMIMSDIPTPRQESPKPAVPNAETRRSMRVRHKPRALSPVLRGKIHEFSERD